MTGFCRRTGMASLLALLPFVTGCASSGCEFLTYETLPRQPAPLVLPEGVPAPPQTGEYRVPDIADAGAASGKCIAEPPMTLPEEMLRAPEEDAASNGEGEAEAA